MEDKKRLTASEIDSLYKLAAIISIYKDIYGLQKRISAIPSAKKCLAGSKGMVKKLFEDVLETIPVEQLLTIDRNMDALRYCIGIKNITSTGLSEDREYGRWLSYESLGNITAGLKDHCMLCNKDTIAQRQCPIRKELDELPVKLTVTEAQANNCRYMYVW